MAELALSGSNAQNRPFARLLLYLTQWHQLAKSYQWII
jgi:hypothetical protein